MIIKCTLVIVHICVHRKYLQDDKLLTVRCSSHLMMFTKVINNLHKDRHVVDCI